MKIPPPDRLARPFALAALFCFAPLAQTPAQAQDVAFPVPSKPVHHAAPKPPTPTTNTTLVILDAAHGGADAGAHLGPDTLEKDLTQSFAERLRAVLATRGFTVILSRNQAVTPPPAPSPNPDNPTPPPVPAVPSEDQRADQANRLRPLACLLLHATGAGHGVHLFTSSLSPLTFADEAPPVLSWNEAQAASVPQSLHLATDLSTALNGTRVPLVMVRSSVPPIDSLTCPAVAVELAPSPGGALADEAYQSHIAEAIADALSSWRRHVEDDIARANAAAVKAADDASPVTTSKKPATKPSSPKPAPIVRRPEPTAAGPQPGAAR